MKKRTFEIEIEETLLRTISIHASSFEEALNIPREKDYNDEIVLDNDDHYETEFRGLFGPPDDED